MLVNFKYPERQTLITFHPERQSFILELKEQVVRDRGIVFMDKGLGKTWKQKIIGFGIPAKQIVDLKEGERAKDWGVIGAALEFLSKQAHERGSPVLVIGGGAACDAGALVASLYRRGVPLILVPTTLLAMVDAAVGGKTAIDIIRNGKIFKNAAGSFYPAQQVHYWPGWLDTLGEAERRSGIGELLKTSWLAGDSLDIPSLAAWANQKIKAMKIWKSIEQAVSYKAAIVTQDPLDTNGIRNALNYGHTLGHAFESIGAGKLSHGEAIAWGMWAESQLIPDGKKFSQHIAEVLAELGFQRPNFLQSLEPGEMIAFLNADKKIRGGKIQLSVLKNPGELQNIEMQPHELAKFAAAVF